MSGPPRGIASARDWAARVGIIPWYAGGITLPYQAILSDLDAQGTPADPATIAWLETNYAGQPYAVLKNTTTSAGARLQGTGSVLAWWGDGTDTSTALTGSDTDVGRTYGSSATRGIVLLGAMAQWRASSAYGNAFAMTRMPNSLTLLHLGYTSVSGDIGAVSALTSLTYLRLNDTSVSGDIGAVSALTNLTELYLFSTSVSGDIGAVSALTSLTYLRLDSTSVSGDIAAVSALTGLTYLYLFNTSVSGATSPTVNSAANLTTVNVSPAALTQAAVDTILSDCVASLALPGRVTCNLRLEGNAAPSATGYDDKATLVSAGWTVTTA